MDKKEELMQPDFIRQLAEALFNQQLSTNWRWYLLMGALTFLASIAGYFLAAYYKARGVTFATKADMEEILRQISETTRVTEEVKSSVSQVEWVSREWRTLRRTKLEELMTAAYSHDQWLEMLKQKWVYHKDVKEPEAPNERMQMLASLYFPEIAIEVNAVKLAFLALYQHIIKNGSSAMEAKHNKDMPAFNAALDEYKSGYGPLYKASLLTIADLEKKVGKLMASFAAT